MRIARRSRGAHGSSDDAMAGRVQCNGADASRGRCCARTPIAQNFLLVCAA